MLIIHWIIDIHIIKKKSKKPIRNKKTVRARSNTNLWSPSSRPRVGWSSEVRHGMVIFGLILPERLDELRVRPGLSGWAGPSKGRARQRA